MTRMLPIPISVGKMIATNYGYDQVVIMARRCHKTPQPHGEHITTYGRNPQHCEVASMMGKRLQAVAQWISPQETADLEALVTDLDNGDFDYLDYDKRSRQIGALRKLIRGN